MTIQNLPQFFNMKFCEKEGYFAPDGYLYLDQQFQTLSLLLSSVNGNVAPDGTISTNGTISTYVQHAQENPYGLTDIPQPGQLVILGVNPPSFTTTQINLIATATNPDGSPVVPVGTIWYDKTTDQLKFKGASAVQTITSV